MAGSPLKRSFTAAMEGGEGFTYLKKRKLSGDEYLSEQHARASVEKSQSPQLGDAEFRPLLPPPRRVGGADGMEVPEIHEPSPTEPNTPSSNGDNDEDADTSSQEERKSFSSLINYDPSSQPQAASGLVLKTVSHAEMLRLRLRVAMFKVRTGQVEVPFQELRTEEERSREREQDAIEEAVAQLRREAFEVQERDAAWRRQEESQSQPAKHDNEDSGFPTLQPAPVLKPTAYSSRMIYTDTYPSSPPPEAERLPAVTPRHRRIECLDPESAEKCDGSCGEQELTSSVVKGRVAEGLLGLRHAA